MSHKSYIAQGYLLADERFQKMHGWARIWFQVHSAYVALEKLIEAGRRSPREEGLDSYFLTVAFLICYGRCFASAGRSLISFDPKEVFRQAPHLLAIHNRIDELRDKFAAHNEHSDAFMTSILVRDEGSTIRMVQVCEVTSLWPELYAFRECVIHLRDYAERGHRKAMQYIARQIGKRLAFESE